MAARYAAKAKARTLLLEEHSAVGWPVQCAGLLGLGAMAESELPGRSSVLQEMRGAAIFSPGGSRLDFKARAPRASVVDRRLFDRALACEALRAGAEMRLCSTVRGIRREGEESVLHLAGGEGGMEHFLHHLLPALESWWLDLGDPRVDATIRQMLVEGVAEGTGGADTKELARRRDAALVRLLEARGATGL